MGVNECCVCVDDDILNVVINHICDEECRMRKIEEGVRANTRYISIGGTSLSMKRSMTWRTGMSPRWMMVEEILVVL